MSRTPLALALALTALVPATAAAQTPTGPAGDAFYTPPSPLPGKQHGDLIWSRTTTGEPALSAAKSTRLVLYRSVGVDRAPIAVSGTVSIPRGKAPRGGWPVITWGHGTTGIPDSCAPSRDTADNPSHLLISYIEPLLDRWLRRGYAVVRTDYEGLGTPGDHPFLIGDSEGRGMLDIVRAARQLNRSISSRVAIAGHSQGGQAALFAARLAPRYTRELRVRGTVAFAPVSHLSEQVGLLRFLTDPSPLSAFVGMIARGLDLARPALNVPAAFTDRAAALYPQVNERCLLGLRDADSWGSIAPADVFRSDVDKTAVISALDTLDDAENLRIRTPVRVEQGTADTTVLPSFTGELFTKLKKRGTPIAYRTYKGVDHGRVVSAGANDATSFFRTRLSR